MTYRVFLSSPSDVQDERSAVDRIVSRLNADLPRDSQLELIMWEDDYYTADATFQDQIVNPADCDLVLCILWGRLGSELPEQYKGDDGEIPTGTEYEFEIAYEQASASDPKIPDILVYKKTSDPVTRVRDAEEAQRQLAKVDRFWKKWFRNEQGHFVAGFHSFFDTEEFETLLEKHLRRWLDDREIPLLWTQGSPFRGLEPFDVEHAPVFFGRARDIQRARARALSNLVAGAPFLIILGPSGSGKSSLVRAGLIPRLMNSGGTSDLPRLDLYAIGTPSVIARGEPGSWAEGLAKLFFEVEALAPALTAGDFDTPERLGALLSRGGEEAVRPILRALDRVHEDQGLILFLDQLEEIFALGPADAQAFAEVVGAFALSGRIMVLASMRTEFQHRLGEIPALHDLCGLQKVVGPNDPRAEIEIGLPNMADLREMITKPAVVAGLEFQGPDEEHDGLAARIEEGCTPATLPALQLLLSELFNRKEGSLLTHAAFDALGGVRGVMARRGDEVLREVSTDVAASLPSLARALVQSSADGSVVVSRRLPLGQFAEKTPERQLALALQNAGLLTSDGESLRLAHESLIKGWDALDEIVLQERRNLAVFNRVVAAFRGFQSAEEKARSGAVLKGLPLDEALALRAEWGAETLDAQAPGLSAFITQSDRARRRGRWIARGTAAVVVATILAAGLFFWQLQESNARAELRAHIGDGQARLRNGEWYRGLESAHAALAAAENAETRSLALNALIEFSSPEFARRIEGSFATIDVRADGQVVALSRTGALLELGDPDEGLDGFPSVPDNSTSPRYLRYWHIPDGAMVALRKDGRVVFLSEDGGAHNLFEPDEPMAVIWPSQADLWSDTREFQLAFGSLGKPGVLLRCVFTSATPDCSRDDLPSGIRSIAARPADGQLLSVGQGGVSLHDLDAPAETMPVPLAPGSSQSVVWMAGGDVAVAGLRDGGLAIGDFTNPEGNVDVIPSPMIAANGFKPVLRPVVSPDGMQLAFDCANGLICIARLSERDPGRLALVAALHRLEGSISDMAWSASGNDLYTVEDNGSLTQWRLQPDQTVAALVAPSITGTSALGVDRKKARVVIGENDGTVTVVDTRTNVAFHLNAGEIKHVAINPAGEIASASNQGDIAVIGADLADNVKTDPLGPPLQRLNWLDDGQTLSATSSEALFLGIPGAGMATFRRNKLFGDDPQLANQTIGGVIPATEGAGAIISLSNGGVYGVLDGRASLLLPLELTEDKLSSFDLDLSPDGQYLVATRSDDVVRIYDMDSKTLAFEVDIPTNDTRVARFSPQGSRLAVLASSGRVYVWTLSANPLGAELFVEFEPAPSFLSAGGEKAIWLEWIDEDTLAVAHQSYGVARVALDPGLLRQRLSELVGDLSAGPDLTQR